MSRGVNKVILIGNLGKDPEVRYFPNGDAFCNVSLATSETWTDKQSGEKKERTEWHNVVFTRKLAEIVGQYLRKGSKVYVEGSLRTRKWEKDGVERYTTEILVNDLQMLDSRQPEGGQPASSGYARTSGAGSGRGAAPPSDHGGFDDDIPFN